MSGTSEYSIVNLWEEERPREGMARYWELQFRVSEVVRAQQTPCISRPHPKTHPKTQTAN